SPEQVVVHLADIGARAAERGDPGHRIAGRSARRLDRRAHHMVKRVSPVRVDQGHRPFDEPLLSEEILLGMSDHIDDGVANADNVESGRCHFPIATRWGIMRWDYRGLSRLGKSWGGRGPTNPRGFWPDSASDSSAKKSSDRAVTP